MSSSRPDQITLVSHKHALTKTDRCGEFICKGCKTYGCGKSYCCIECNYYLHDHCATCPLTLKSFMHPQHKLKLVSKKPQTDPKCNICHESTEGIYFQCEPCGFNVHPLCTKLPQHVKHVPHPAHDFLELSNQGGNTKCAVCDGAIESWRYKCGPCKLVVHMECVSLTAPSSSTTQQRGFGSQHQYHSFQYQHHYHNHGQGYMNHAHSFQYNYQPYHNHGYMNHQGNNPGYNQGQNPGSTPSAGRPIFQVLMALTVGTVSSWIADALGDAIGIV